MERKCSIMLQVKKGKRLVPIEIGNNSFSLTCFLKGIHSVWHVFWSDDIKKTDICDQWLIRLSLWFDFYVIRVMNRIIPTNGDSCSVENLSHVGSLFCCRWYTAMTFFCTGTIFYILLKDAYFTYLKYTH